jgi:hypothetical protein
MTAATPRRVTIQQLVMEVYLKFATAQVWSSEFKIGLEAYYNVSVFATLPIGSRDILRTAPRSFCCLLFWRYPPYILDSAFCFQDSVFRLQVKALAERVMLPFEIHEPQLYGLLSSSFGLERAQHIAPKLLSITRRYICKKLLTRHWRCYACIHVTCGNSLWNIQGVCPP